MKKYIVCVFTDSGAPSLDAAGRIDVVHVYEDQNKAVERARIEARNSGRPRGVLESTIIVRPQERPVTVTVIS